MDARQHRDSPPAGRWLRRASGRIGPSRSQACTHRRKRRVQPRRATQSSENRALGRPPEMGVRTQRGDLGRRHARQPPGPVLRPAGRMSVTRANASGKVRSCQWSCAPRHRPSGSTGEPVAANGSSSRAKLVGESLRVGMLVVEGRQGQRRRRPSARPRLRAPPARCSRSARGRQARPAPPRPRPRSRRGRDAGRAARSGPHRGVRAAPGLCPHRRAAGPWRWSCRRRERRWPSFGVSQSSATATAGPCKSRSRMPPRAQRCIRSRSRRCCDLS